MTEVERNNGSPAYHKLANSERRSVKSQIDFLLKDGSVNKKGTTRHTTYFLLTQNRDNIE
ncbi:hypothetical protein GGR27_003709 [Lewinella antarctica]|uniref:Uncharacterized protein n=1 Tax=Neolewinella antarctica TaxID=442734 RepID=A0ABX0XHD8_9BACT|nr:hypothetical protein [Neolewinella antarctica]